MISMDELGEAPQSTALYLLLRLALGYSLWTARHCSQPYIRNAKRPFASSLEPGQLPVQTQQSYFNHVPGVSGKE